MNFSMGIYYTIFQPRLMIIPLTMNIMLTFFSVLGVYFGFSLNLLPSVEFGQTQPMGLHATFPFWMPFLDDVKMPFHFLNGNLTQANWIFSIIAIILVLFIKSYLIGMYLGSMKCYIVGSDNTYFVFKIANYYFKRMIVLSIIELLLGVLFVGLALLFWPLAIIAVIALLFYSLTPYILVLDDISVMKAIVKAPEVFKKNFRTLFLLALACMLFTFLLTMFTFLEKDFAYYFILLSYSFIGTVYIFAVMNQLHGSLTNSKSIPSRNVNKAKRFYFPLVLIILLLPLLGVWFASGQYLRLLDYQEKTTLRGIHYMANWSDAYAYSNQQYTTYNWDSEKQYSITLSLPDFSNGEEYTEIKGTGTVTWYIEQRKEVRNGHDHFLTMEPTKVKSNFMYRLIKHQSESGKIFYSTENGSSSFLGGNTKGYEPLSLQMMISGDGKNVFLSRLPSRFEQGFTLRPDQNGEYLIPTTSQMNPGDFHYYWFTEDITVHDVFKLIKSKNENSFISNDNLFEQLAAAMQEGNGKAVKAIFDEMEQQKITNNLPNRTAEEWDQFIQKAYKGKPLPTVLRYLDRAGNQAGYTIEEVKDNKINIATYRAEIPFPNKSVLITYSIEQNGKMVEFLYEETGGTR